MKKRFSVWGLVCAIAVSAAMAGVATTQERAKVHVKIPVVAARAEDVSSPEAIVKADLECISGGLEAPRQWGRDASLYDPHAQLVALGVDPDTEVVTKHSFSVQEFADQGNASMVERGFNEYELAHVTHRYGNVATVFSSYEIRYATTGEVDSRGVNIYQLYFDGKRWWILSVVWDEEREGNPIPAELLPKK